jgi:hypothetical protein
VRLFTLRKKFRLNWRITERHCLVFGRPSQNAPTAMRATAEEMVSQCWVWLLGMTESNGDQVKMPIQIYNEGGAFARLARRVAFDSLWSTASIGAQLVLACHAASKLFTFTRFENRRDLLDKTRIAFFVWRRGARASMGFRWSRKLRQ